MMLSVVKMNFILLNVAAPCNRGVKVLKDKLK